jgi:uncharacterized DUF497 family protein
LIVVWRESPIGTKALGMRIEYDAAKSHRNARRRGLDFADAMELLSGPHLIRDDPRRDYGEQRVIASGLIRGRMHVCVHTLRGDAYRIISLRKANRREVDAYGPYVLR